MSGQSGGRIRLSKLNDQLTCKLCRGYFIDATTIIECLHSFCRSCIVKYLETTKYCPICEVQVHKSKPLLNIRPDHTLQDIVYKLVPGCYQNEMRCRREFYEMHPEAQLSSMSPEARGEPIESHIYSPDESLSLSLEYYNPNVNEGAVIPMDDSKESVAMIALTAASLAAMPGNITTVAGMTTSITNTITTTTTTTTTITSTSGTTTITGKLLPRRYLRCPAAVTVFHLQKLIRAKYGLSDAHRVDVMYKEESLCGNYTLMDVMYIYHWRRKVPLHLSYRIFESSPKRLKLSDDNTHFKESLTNAGISSVEPKDENLKREWKEVQLKISETGVMSVTGITSPESKKVPVSESLEDDQRRLDESVAAVVMTDKKLTNNTKELASQQSISDLNSKNHDEQRQQQQTQRNSEKFNDNQTDTRKNTTTTSSATTTTTKPPTEAKPVTTTTTATTTTNNNNNSNNNNNNNNNNSNNYNSTHEPASKLDTREKHKNTTASDTKNYQLPSGSGSKIDALSVKLQFQPKVGQVNNTYSKKTSKDKTMLEKVLKKSDSKNLFKDGQMEIKNISDKNRAICRTSGVCTSSKSSTNFQSKITIGQSQCTISSTSIDTPNTNTITSTYSTISTPSVSISITSQKNLSPDRNKESTGSSHLLSGNLHKCRKGSGENTESSNQRSISNQITNTPSSSGGGKSGFVRQNNNPTLNSESLANIGLNVSTAFLGLGSSSSGSSSTFPYTVQDLVNNAMLKSPSKNVGSTCGQKQSGISGSISVSAASHQVSTPSSLQFNIQTPSMSVYSIPNTTKNNTNANSNSNNSNNMKGNSKANLEITTAYSVPPCPDAIPISMMKPTIRKTEIIAKGTNINDICAKIGTSGSKINDICAKIGESSKEKNKTDTRLRPEIPDLLKITKKPISSMNTNDNTVMKHIPNIPNVPIYTPSNNVSSSDTRAIYMNKDTSKIMSMTTATPVTVTAMTATATTTTITATTTTANNATVTTITTTSAITSMTNTPTTTTMTTGSSTSGTTILSSSSSSSSSTISSGTVTTITPSTSSFHHVSGRGNSMKRSQSQSVGYKTLRDPPKSWNPTLSKNNYVAAKNQAKEQQNQLQPSSLMSEVSGSDGNNGGKNSIGSKPAKIFKMRNMPRYLGNPASGVKPMYGLNNEGKDNKEQTITSTASPTTSKNNVTSGLSMTKIDPKTLSPIISTNTNSPIVSPPPYSPNARSYQNTPFSRSGNSPLSPRNSPVNMLSTNPFIPSPTPNTNPRLIYSHFLPFPDGSRFANPLIRSPIGIPPPSAFHSSLPPSINKLYQRSSYMPQTTCATYAQQQGLTTQPPTVQRIPPSTHSSSSSSSSSSTSTSSSSSSSSPKSPKTTVTSSTFNLAKTETQTSIPTSLDINNVHTAKNQTDQDSNAFNLCKIPPVTTGGTSQSNYVSDLSKTSTCNVDTVKQSENDDKVSGEGENVNKNNDQIDDDGKKNVAVKDKNKAEDDTRINNEEKEQKHDQKDKMAEVKKNKKNKRKDKIILKEINIKRQLRDSHCTTGTDVKNPLSKNSNNESQMARENDDNAASNVNDQSSSITKENPTARPPNSNLSDTKNISSNQHQTVTVDNNSTDELKLKDNNTTESKNTLVDDVFPKIVNDNNEKDSGNPEREELMKNEKHVQSKISEIQISKAES